ncbi:hypothetical protein OUZ56_032132 [Daphnia magna]|uniref:Uncharacterized protein n=1 Tax=Daphnia magna TaxID=35525 RepID=A0ABQ9ZW86_9CRUS|nr:hypothetical protein OUZ56_032132 [Daphnia magna]
MVQRRRADSTALAARSVGAMLLQRQIRGRAMSSTLYCVDARRSKRATESSRSGHPSEKVPSKEGVKISRKALASEAE